MILIENGANDVSKNDQETCGSIKTEISLTKLLRRQNSLQTTGESISPLMNHILMLLKFYAKGLHSEDCALCEEFDVVREQWAKFFTDKYLLLALARLIELV
ncbi:uncharacterized protein [Spinacia oleracea]|uniref:Uncharacterized protein n=1 Tax=Spinacia oleracea TaxID=3562 RepID=A0ABM3QPI7_SPIOL|nr:uncharacterized protein LOC110804618 [Spinacia oleracea]